MTPVPTPVPMSLPLMAHAHPAPGDADSGVLLAVACVVPVVAVLCYLAAAACLRRRGDAWPRPRDVSFAAGGVALVAAFAGPAPGGPFAAHMAQHLVAGMAAPLLFVLGRPLTLVLRVLPPGRVRRALPRIAHSRAAGWLTFPPIAALPSVVGVWVLYRTPLFAATHDRPVLHAAVHVHVVTAGVLFAFSVCRLDPVRSRWGVAWRGGTLLAASAAHAVLAKGLYATPPPGTAFDVADLRSGAWLMYYGGDLVEVAVAVVVAVQWYRETGRAYARAGRRLSRVALPTVACGGGPDRVARSAVGPHDG